VPHRSAWPRRPRSSSPRPGGCQPRSRTRTTPPSSKPRRPHAR
jgi:hypothetical protein